MSERTFLCIRRCKAHLKWGRIINKSEILCRDQEQAFFESESFFESLSLLSEEEDGKGTIQEDSLLMTTE